MPTLDDRITEAFIRAAAPVDGSGLFPLIDRRHVRAGRLRRVRMGIAAVAVVLGTAGGLLVLNRAFERSATLPAQTPTVAPTPPPSSVATAGCDAPSRATADVDGDGTPDQLRVHCAEGDGPWILDVDWGNGASARRPLASCVQLCQIYATPDLDDDGAAELAVRAADASVSNNAFLEFYRLPVIEPDPDPLTVTGTGAEGWDGRFELGGDEVFHAAVGCDGLGNLIATSATQRHDGSWMVRAITLRLLPTGFDVTGDRTGRFPEAFDPGAYALCGAQILDHEGSSLLAEEGPTLPGVPFDVCNVRAIPGNFGQGSYGLAYVFEEANPPGAPCNHGSEGFQHVAVAPDGRTVTSMSPRLISCSVGAKCWPFATPDIDGDGIDEVAVAVGGGDREVWFELYRTVPAVTVMPGVRWCRNGACQEGRGFPLFWGVSEGPKDRAGVSCTRDTSGVPLLLAFDAGGKNGTGYEILPDRLEWRPDVVVGTLTAAHAVTAGRLCGAEVYDFVPFSGQ
jgi:hypothetical protein